MSIPTRNYFLLLLLASCDRCDGCTEETNAPTASSNTDTLYTRASTAMSYNACLSPTEVANLLNFPAHSGIVVAGSVTGCDEANPVNMTLSVRCGVSNEVELLLSPESLFCDIPGGYQLTFDNTCAVEYQGKTYITASSGWLFPTGIVAEIDTQEGIHADLELYNLRLGVSSLWVGYEAMSLLAQGRDMTRDESRVATESCD